MKKVFIFLICLIPWLLGSFVPIDKSFYQSLNLPFFTPPSLFFTLAWLFTYISIAISIFLILKKYDFKLSNVPSSYKKPLLINYLFNQSFQLVFFTFKSPFLGFISTLGTFISALFLYEATSSIDEDVTKYLNIYILLSLFATTLSLTIYFLNI